MSEALVKLYGMNMTVINYSDIISYVLNKVLNFNYINTSNNKFVSVQAMKDYREMKNSSTYS